MNKKTITLVIVLILVVTIVYAINFYNKVMNVGPLHTNCPKFSWVAHDNGKQIINEEEAKEVFLDFKKQKLSDINLEATVEKMISFNVKANPEGDIIEGWVPYPYGRLLGSDTYGYKVHGYFIGKNGKIYSFSYCQ